MLLRWLLRQASDAQLILGARAAHTALQPLRLASWRMPLLPQVAVVHTVSTCQPSVTTVVTADVHMIRTYLRPTKKTSVGSAFLLCGCLSWVGCSSRRPQLNSDVVRPPPQTRNRVAADLLAFTEKLKSIGEAVFSTLQGSSTKACQSNAMSWGLSRNKKRYQPLAVFSSLTSAVHPATQEWMQIQQKKKLSQTKNLSCLTLRFHLARLWREQRMMRRMNRTQRYRQPNLRQLLALEMHKYTQRLPRQIRKYHCSFLRQHHHKKKMISAFLSQLVPRRMKTCQRHRQPLDYAGRGR